MNKTEYIQYLEKILLKGGTLYHIIGRGIREKIFSQDEMERVLADIISKNRSRLPSETQEKFNSTNKAWNSFCQSFGRDSQGDSSPFVPSSSNFSLKMAGNTSLKGKLLLPCGDNISPSKYAKKLAKGVVNMQSMVEMWANTRPEILSVISCDVDSRGIVIEDYTPYLTITVSVECDLIAYFDY